MPNRYIASGQSKLQVVMLAIHLTWITHNGRSQSQTQDLSLSAFYCSWKHKRILLSTYYWWRVVNEHPVYLCVTYWQNLALTGMDFATVNCQRSSVSSCRHEPRYGHWRTSLAGDYTVVASTFEAELLGKFILTVASMVNVQVEAIPAEGAVSFALACLYRNMQLTLYTT